MNNDRRYPNDDVEIIEIDDYEIDIIEVEDDISFDLPSCEKRVSKSFLDKVREKLSGHKFAVVTTCAVTLIVTLTSVFLLKGGVGSKPVLKSQSNVAYSTSIDDIDFKLNDEGYSTISVNGDYVEKGASLFIDGEDYSKDVVIDSSDVDTTRIGTYHVTYTYVAGMNQIKTLYRTVNVVDNDAPIIKLLGSNVYTMLVNDSYNEAGVIVLDNSNEELLENVVIENNVDVTTPGVYSIKYSVSDNSGNQAVAYRTVVVKYSYSSSTNSVLSNSFTNNGISLSGMVNVGNFKYQMMLKNKDTGNESIINLVSTGYNYYQFNLDVTNMENGNYDLYLVTDSLEPLISNMTIFNRIVRSHVGNKLVTMTYDKNIVNMKVEDFSYQYDIVIDPGHGGAEYGAVNGRYYEKSINLEQSLYEKQRYEAHGLRVLILRDTDDNYGIVMGEEGMEPVDRKAFAVGYYGAVSKVIYSNHHNSSGNTSSAGWEILIPAAASYDDLSVEHQIAEDWSNMYIRSVNPYYRFYTRDYETGKPSNKINGEVYGFEDFYSVIRIPNKLYNVKNVLFEGAYINNDSDMYWYYNSENWKKLSEVKIKHYVESIGVKYIEP